jgi:hypothetical protein
MVEQRVGVKCKKAFVWSSICFILSLFSRDLYTSFHLHHPIMTCENSSNSCIPDLHFLLNISWPPLSSQQLSIYQNPFGLKIILFSHATILFFPSKWFDLGKRRVFLKKLLCLLLWDSLRRLLPDSSFIGVF